MLLLFLLIWAVVAAPALEVYGAPTDLTLMPASGGTATAVHRLSHHRSQLERRTFSGPGGRDGPPGNSHSNVVDEFGDEESQQRSTGIYWNCLEDYFDPVVSVFTHSLSFSSAAPNFGALLPSPMALYVPHFKIHHEWHHGLKDSEREVSADNLPS